MTYKATLFRSPLSLPEGSSGKVRVTHRTLPAGSDVPVVGVRQAVLRGIRPAGLKLQEPLTNGSAVDKNTRGR